ncbi:MAG: methyltransferase domain-containing protein [Armatimonadota bacterium]|nr:methyltransferase domain-containing protein [Armatimonadota bacterium]
MTGNGHTHHKTAFFDQHAAHWDAETPEDMPQRLSRVVRAARLQPGARVLDVGSGTGVLIPAVLAAVGESGWVVALDISAEMLKRAREKGYGANVSWILGDAQRIGVRNAVFDAVFCNAALPHFNCKEAALAELARVLRPGGVLIISHPIGREAVNRLHREAGGPVREDRVPPPALLSRWLQQNGLTVAQMVDEPDFFLTAAHKPMAR